MPARSDGDVDALLEYLKHTRGFDFTGYKRASLARRIEKRMQTVDVASPVDYIDYLEVHPEEFQRLFDTVLINVTSFFRDPSTWEVLAASVLPDLLARRAGLPIRVWSAGCASGEEAYTLAMLFAEVLGFKEFRDRVKIYATDADESALARARLAVYSERDVAQLPPGMRERYFEPVESSFAFRKDLRRNVIFGRHDLIQDAPISRVDLLSCRNTLMYFNAETQTGILARFQFALVDGGILLLGRAETLMTHATTFSPVDLPRRISMKIPGVPLSVQDRRLLANADGAKAAASAIHHQQQARAREMALESSPTAQIVVDVAGTMVAANERARTAFGLSAGDVGRPLQDLKVSYRPVELRSAIERVYAERRVVILQEVEWQAPAGDTRFLDVHVSPLVETTGTVIGAGISFSDATLAKRLRVDLEHANQELETAYEELQSTNEELETTNEELQSTVEELETTNEELQSTNEELETMNEELQSTNEELHTVNDVLRDRSDALNQVNVFLESILGSIRGGVVVVDRDLKIMIWNEGAEDLWGLREAEVQGKNLLGLDIGLPTEQLKQPLQSCLGGAQGYAEVTLRATNRRGRSIDCHVICTPLLSRTDEMRGAILVMDDEGPAARSIGLRQPRVGGTSSEKEQSGRPGTE